MSNGWSATRCTRPMIQAASGMPSTTTGTPYIDHSIKLIRTPAMLSSRPTAIALVGDPTIVPSPPMLAAKAIPIGSAPAMPSWCGGASPDATLPPPCNTASAIGIMISVVEVLEISIDNSAAEIMKANSNVPAPPRPPTARRIARLNRRCSPVRSIASAMNAPPNSRNRIGE